MSTNRGPTPPATGKALPWLQRPLTNPGGQESSTGGATVVPRRNQTKRWGFPTPPSATQPGPAALPVVYGCTASFSCCITRISASAWAGCLGWGFDMQPDFRSTVEGLAQLCFMLVLFVLLFSTPAQSWLLFSNCLAPSDWQSAFISAPVVILSADPTCPLSGPDDYWNREGVIRWCS